MSAPILGANQHSAVLGSTGRGSETDRLQRRSTNVVDCVYFPHNIWTRRNCPGADAQALLLREYVYNVPTYIRNILFLVWFFSRRFLTENRLPISRSVSIRVRVRIRTTLRVRLWLPLRAILFSSNFTYQGLQDKHVIGHEY